MKLLPQTTWLGCTGKISNCALTWWFSAGWMFWIFNVFRLELPQSSDRSQICLAERSFALQLSTSTRVSASRVGPDPEDWGTGDNFTHFTRDAASAL